jgi:uncharacterized protein
LWLLCGAEELDRHDTAENPASFDIALLHEMIFRGAEVKAADTQGLTALHFAARSRPINWIEALLRAGADVNASAGNGQTALHQAMQQLAEHRMGVSKALLLGGADPNLAAVDGTTAQGLALLNGDFELAEILQWPGDDHQRRPLRDGDVAHAAQTDNEALVKYYLGLGLNVDGADARGATALIHASGRGRLSMVQLLLEHGAQTGIVSPTGISALSAATMAGHDYIIDALHRVGVDINAAPAGGLPALTLACARLQLGCVQMLLQRGADPNGAGVYPWPLWSALQAAINAGEPSAAMACAVSLLRAGANVDFADEDGRSSLLLLVGSQQSLPPSGNESTLVTLINLLLDFKADIAHVDRTGRSALHWACRHSLLHCAKRLIERGASIESVDETRKLPLDLAPLIVRAQLSGWMAERSKLV